ncbi:MAG: serine/threonine protein kinase [Methylobacter sp.]|jgi:Ser/Thr protein kinase RdoA (MazF antagonist)|nr:serine/threonine protein kinase [Methylobacter sp.]
MNTNLTPFSALTPDLILTALDGVGLPSDGRLLALNSYENRVYQVGMTDASFIVTKFYRPERWTTAAIAEEHNFVQELFDAEIPVVPALPFGDKQTLIQADGFRFSVYPRQGGRVPELEGRDKLEWMGRLIARIHAVGALKPFQQRPTLDIAGFGDEPRAFLLAHDFIPADLVAAYRSVTEHALAGVRRCFERAGAVKSLRLHGDCYPGNILWTDDGPHFVDFDDSRMGPAIQDLWMLLSGDRAEMTVQLNYLLAGYRTFYDFDSRELHLLEALRTLRLIHYSAWIARRWDDPAFPMAFPWFDTPRYWQDRIIELREQIALMDEGPLELA